jgi:hypothetical protein
VHSEEKLPVLIFQRGYGEERVVFLKLFVLVAIGNGFVVQSSPVETTSEKHLGKFVIIGRTIYLHRKYYRPILKGIH